MLGSTEFVTALQRTAAAAAPVRAPRMAFTTVCTRVCRHLGLPPAALTSGGAAARAGIAYLWVAVLGHAGRPLAASLGVSPQAVYQAVTRGQTTRAEWEQLLKQ